MKPDNNNYRSHFFVTNTFYLNSFFFPFLEAKCYLQLEMLPLFESIILFDVNNKILMCLPPLLKRK